MKHTKNVILKAREQALPQKTQVVQCHAWSPKCNRCTYYNKKGLWEVKRLKTVFLLYPVSKTGFLLQKRFRIER